MTHKKLVSLLAGAMMAGGAMVANADTVSDKFAAMDTNADGGVTLAEFVTYATSDGKHTAEEAGTKFAEISGDDGLLTLEELEAAYAEKEETPTHEGGGS